MKKLILLILLLAMAAANATAARMYPAGGRVVDEQGQAVEYATVVLLWVSIPFCGRCASKRTTIWATSC